MAKQILNNAGLKVAGTDLTNHVQSIEISEEWDEVDVTAMGDSAKTTLLGIQDASMKVTFFQDFAASSVDSVLNPLAGSNTGFTVVAYANGTTATATSPSYTMVAVLPSYQPISGGVGEASMIDVTFRNASSAGITRGTA